MVTLAVEAADRLARRRPATCSRPACSRARCWRACPTGSTSPRFSFAAPPGSFYVRMHTLSGAAKSRASSEIRVLRRCGDRADGTLESAGRGQRLEPRVVVAQYLRRRRAHVADPGCQRPDRERIAPAALSETFTSPAFRQAPTRSACARSMPPDQRDSNPVTLTFPTNCSGSPSDADQLLRVARRETSCR